MQLIKRSNRHSVINHGDVNLAAQELLGIPCLRQGKCNNSSKCDMHDTFTTTCLNTMKQLLQ